jgi:hypothetical protein
MTVDRLKDVPGFSVDRLAAAAGADPDVLWLVEHRRTSKRKSE